MALKRCTKCGTWKDENEFAWRYKTLGARQKACRSCRAQENAQWYERHHDKHRENVIHHANARHLIVKLKIKKKDIELLIQDDGIGFSPETSLTSGHFGLASVRERAQLAGGEFIINSQPNCGTTIRLVIKGCVE